jgi:hypothetical protein
VAGSKLVHECRHVAVRHRGVVSLGLADDESLAALRDKLADS